MANKVPKHELSAEAQAALRTFDALPNHEGAVLVWLDGEQPGVLELLEKDMLDEYVREGDDSHWVAISDAGRSHASQMR